MQEYKLFFDTKHETHYREIETILLSQIRAPKNRLSYILHGLLPKFLRRFFCSYVVVQEQCCIKLRQYFPDLVLPTGANQQELYIMAVRSDDNEKEILGGMKFERSTSQYTHSQKDTNMNAFENIEYKKGRIRPIKKRKLEL